MQSICTGHCELETISLQYHELLRTRSSFLKHTRGILLKT